MAKIERRALREATIEAIRDAAEKHGAFAAPVFNRGTITQMFLYRGGELEAAVYSLKDGGLTAWKSVGRPVKADNAEAVVRKALRVG